MHCHWQLKEREKQEYIHSSYLKSSKTHCSCYSLWCVMTQKNRRRFTGFLVNILIHPGHIWSQKEIESTTTGVLCLWRGFVSHPSRLHHFMLIKWDLLCLTSWWGLSQGHWCHGPLTVWQMTVSCKVVESLVLLRLEWSQTRVFLSRSPTSAKFQHFA